MAVRLEGHPDSVLTMAFLPDGHLSSGSRNRTARLWEVERMEATEQFATECRTDGKSFGIDGSSPGMGRSRALSIILCKKIKVL
jgi:WD40 repeat protein